MTITWHLWTTIYAFKTKRLRIMNFLEIFAVLLLLWAGLSHYRRKYGNFPPGPYGLPLLGYLPFVRKDAHKVIANLTKKYGSVFSLNFGFTPIVFVNDYETIKEVLIRKGDVFSGRPSTITFEAVFGGKDIATSEGPQWREMRRFLMRHLRDFGVGKSSLEPVVVGEVDKVIEFLDKKNGEVVRFDEILVIPIMNVIWSITADTTFAFDDKFIVQFKDDFQNLIEVVGATGVLNCLPILRYVAPKLSGYEVLCKSSEKVKAFLQMTVASRSKGTIVGHKKDMIDAYMEEIERRREKNGEEAPPFTEEHMTLNMKTLFMAGTETGVTILKWSFLMMALRPDIQKRVHEELDSKIGVDCTPSWNQKNLLPYIEATLYEILRYFSITPLSMPHATLTTTNLAGYTIPKGTCIVTNLWALHFDPKYWEKPEEFRPERFIDEDGKIRKFDWFMPFSGGPRFCLGEPIARLEHFIFFTHLMQKFRFECDPNGPRPSLEPVEAGVLTPKPFSLKVTRRNC